MRHDHIQCVGQALAENTFINLLTSPNLLRLILEGKVTKLTSLKGLDVATDVSENCRDTFPEFEVAHCSMRRSLKKDLGTAYRVQVLAGDRLIEEIVFSYKSHQ